MRGRRTPRASARASTRSSACSRKDGRRVRSRDLVISSKTVATHIQHILSKLGVNTRAQAVAMAFRRGLVEPDVRAHALALLVEPTAD